MIIECISVQANLFKYVWDSTLILAFLQAPSNVNGDIRIFSHRSNYEILGQISIRSSNLLKKNFSTAINRFFGSRTGFRQNCTICTHQEVRRLCIFRRECELESDILLTTNGGRWIMIGTFFGIRWVVRLSLKGASNRKYAVSWTYQYCK